MLSVSDRNSKLLPMICRGGLWPAALLLTVWLPVSTAADPAAEPLHLEILQLKSVVPIEYLDHISRSVEIHLRITNQTDQPLKLKRSDLQLLCEKAVCRPLPARSDPGLTGDRNLAVGETIEGWVTFQLIRPSAEEPVLTLSCTVGDSRQSVSLNEALRRLVNPQFGQLGYQQKITVLSIERTLDLLTLWVLHEQMRMLKNQGVDRLVLDAHPHESSQVDSKILNWLQLASASAQSGRRRRAHGFSPPPRFQEFHVTGFHYGGNSSIRIMHRSRERAVAAAAHTLYQQLSTEEAVGEFQTAEPGIRRAALESSIDRLSEAELVQVLATMESSQAGSRRLILELLDRVTSSAGVEKLRSVLITSLAAPPTRSDSFAPETVAVAARTLVRCVAPGTGSALQDVWKAAADSRSLQETIIEEVLRTEDHRWTTLVAEYAGAELDRLSSAESADQGNADEPVRSGRISRVLRDSLRFLHSNAPAFQSVAMRRLLAVTIPDVQDELLRIVVAADEQDLARACIAQRLESGAVTAQLLGMIHLLPDSRWTMRLFELHRLKTATRSDRASTLTAALRCATEQQLDEIIDQVDDLDPLVRPHLYQQLVAMHHPRCAELLKRALGEDEARFSAALRYLPASESAEVLQLVMDRYELFRQQAAEKGSLEGADFRMARMLLVQLGPIEHPEARRLMNLTLISPDPGLRAEALHQISGSHNRSRARTSRQENEIRRLKQQGEFDEALQRINQLIAQDSFCADFLMTRASLRMRRNQIREAATDVAEANRLSPGDVFTESTLALLQVRSGQIEDGIEEAERVMKQVPAAATMYYNGTLYNTACVYARALESDNLTAEQGQQYTERAIELMRLSADAGFYDEQHVLNDPDLVTLHDHEEWSVIMQQITVNQRPKR